MSESMTPEAFREALFSHKYTLPQLRNQLERIPVGQRAATLLAVFTDPARPDAYGDQVVAGNLLVASTPETHNPLEEILSAIAPVWNVSVEQLPFYLRDVYGLEAVVEASQRLARGFPPDSIEATALVTIAWWLSGKRSRVSAEQIAPPDHSGE